MKPKKKTRDSRPRGKQKDPLAQAPPEESLQILALRRDHLVQVNQPLVLISQIGRSGGTLLMRLLDGHPQCHTIPHELLSRIHAPPELLIGADSAWKHLYDAKLQRRFEKGVRQAHRHLSQSEELHPMIIPPFLQRHLFESCLARHVDPSRRVVLDCYMTSYFNAWLDNQNLYGSDKRWITGFAPSFLGGRRKVEGYNATYPDGRILSMARDPLGWYASARLWNERRWGDPKRAMDEWCGSARRTIELKQQFGPRFYVLTFEALVSQTKGTMRAVTEHLGIRFTPETLIPTFNRLPVKANSSFKVTKGRMLSKPLDRHRQLLSADDTAYVNGRGRELYEEVCRLAEVSASEVPLKAVPAPRGKGKKGSPQKGSAQKGSAARISAVN